MISLSKKPRIVLPFGDPNGSIIYNAWASVEDQRLDNTYWGFLIFEEGHKIEELEQYVLREVGSALYSRNPAGSEPFRVFKTRDIFTRFFYIGSETSENGDASWMHKKSPRVIRYEKISRDLDGEDVEKLARYISRKR